MKSLILIASVVTCCVVRNAQGATISDATRADMTIVLERMTILRDNLKAAYETGKDPAIVKFPCLRCVPITFHDRPVNRDVLPGYVNTINDRIEAIKKKLLLD